MTEPIKQPEPLRLADALDDEFVSGRISNDTGRKAAAELRRLHGEVEKLRADHATLLDNASIEVRRMRAESNKMEAEVERLRADAKQALEALEAMNPYPASKEETRNAALKALRAALKEPK